MIIMQDNSSARIQANAISQFQAESCYHHIPVHNLPSFGNGWKKIKCKMLHSSEGNCKLKCPKINGHSIPCEILKIIQINKIKEEILTLRHYILLFTFLSLHAVSYSR